MNRVLWRAARLGLAFVAPLAAFAGDLNPPTGPIVATMKPLSEIEPRIPINATNTPGGTDCVFEISSPGSYYLTGLLLVAPGKYGIKISNDDITIDLNGYRIGGIAGTSAGIQISGANRRNINIRNGIIEHCQGSGINFRSNNSPGRARGCRVEDVTVSDCSGTGLELGDHSTAVRVIAVGNAYDGIFAPTGCVLHECVASDNGGSGFGVFSGNTISNCCANWNGQTGIDATSANRIFGCTACGNGDIGIRAGGNCLVKDCTLSGNENAGIKVLDHNQIIDNTLYLNGWLNGGDGAAISVVNSHNRLEGNHCTYSDNGIKVTSEYNVIVRNTCSYNSLNWSIIENNIYGPIINRTNISTPAVSGNSAPSALGTTDLNANFSN